MDLAGNIGILQGFGEMEAGSEQCKEPDDDKLLQLGPAELSVRR
jgi:hypothetical protein